MLDRRYDFAKSVALFGIIVGLLLLVPSLPRVSAAASAKVAAPGEYATLVLNDPWDMSEKG
jgi:hypothetical protein